MFYKNLVLYINNEEILYLYVQNNYEFALAFYNENKKLNFKDQVIRYIRNNNINFFGEKVFIVVNNLIVGSLSLNNSILKKIVDINLLDFNEEDEVIDVLYDEDII